MYSDNLGTRLATHSRALNMLLLQVLVFLVGILVIQRWLKLRKFQHFPGFSTWSSLPFIGHTYKMVGGKPIEKVCTFCV